MSERDCKSGEFQHANARSGATIGDGEIFDFATAIGWRPATTIGARCAARLVVCAFATLLGLWLATEARAADESSGDVASAVAEQPALEQSAPPDQPESAPPEQPPPEQPPAEPPPTEPPPAEQPPAEPPPTEPPPAEPSAEPPPTAEQPSPVAEQPPAPEAPAAPAPADPAAQPPVTDDRTAPVKVDTAVVRGESIVTIRRAVSPPRLPSLLPSPGGGDRLATQNGSRSETRNERPQAAESAGQAPLLPSPPFGPGAPADLYVGAGGMGGGSSGGFFPLVLAVLVALFVAVAQRPGGLVPVTLARPRCTALLLCLERPD